MNPRISPIHTDSLAWFCRAVTLTAVRIPTAGNENEKPQIPQISQILGLIAPTLADATDGREAASEDDRVAVGVGRACWRVKNP